MNTKNKTNFIWINFAKTMFVAIFLCIVLLTVTINVFGYNSNYAIYGVAGIILMANLGWFFYQGGIDLIK